MTISSTTTHSGPYNCNGSTTEFAAGFPFFAETDIEVILITAATGAETTLTLTTHYTVAGGSGTTGTVTTVSTYSSAYQIRIDRATARAQAVDLANQGTYYPAVLEASLDKLTLQVQDLARDVARSFKLSKADEDNMPAELATITASRAIGIDADGDLTLLTSSALDTIEAAETAQTAAEAAQTAAEAAQTATEAIAADVVLRDGTSGYVLSGIKLILSNATADGQLKATSLVVYNTSGFDQAETDDIAKEETNGIFALNASGDTLYITSATWSAVMIVGVWLDANQTATAYFPDVLVNSNKIYVSVKELGTGDKSDLTSVVDVGPLVLQITFMAYKAPA